MVLKKTKISLPESKEALEALLARKFIPQGGPTKYRGKIIEIPKKMRCPLCGHVGGKSMTQCPQCNFPKNIKEKLKKVKGGG